MADFELTPTIVTELYSKQDPTLDDSVDIDVSEYIDIDGATSIDEDGNVETDDVGIPGILESDSVVTDNELPDDVEEEVDPPIRNFNTDGWEPVNYKYDEDGNFVVLDEQDETLTPNFESDDVMTSDIF